jgi:hypothetical protein
MATERAKRTRIMLNGDPEPWDTAVGGELYRQPPSEEYPEGRVVRLCYWLSRWHGASFRRQFARADFDDVTITEEDACSDTPEPPWNQPSAFEEPKP